MNTFHWTIFLHLSSLFFACGLFQPDPKEEDEDQTEYEAQLSRIFSGSLFDYFTNHNQALDILEALTEDGLLQEKPATLIHFDSHSDMYRIPRKEGYSNYGQGAADYINSLMLEGKVEEIYWVLPDVTRSLENQEMFWNPETNVSGDVPHTMFSGPRTQTFYIDERDSDISFEKPADRQFDLFNL